MPVQKTWDHAIELKKGFTLKKEKVYSLSREEREKVQTFVEDQLRKGYIQPSKSPQTSPVHFVVKKDSAQTICYENPKQEKVSYAFKHLMQNLKAYNGVGA